MGFPIARNSAHVRVVKLKETVEIGIAKTVRVAMVVL